MTLPCPDAQDIVIIGATGDLARRKLLPALYNLYRAGLIPEHCEIIGMARRDVGEAGFKTMAREAIEEFSRTDLDEDVWREFESKLYFTPLAKGYEELKRHCHEAVRLIYLATPPDSMAEVVRNLQEHGLAEGARLILEKPFGTDLESSRQLNALLHDAFREDQIYRIDHYLGKETVQNILVFRFANSVFERVWDRDAIEQVQITIAESIGIEGRGSLYERVGALRDIVQNHALQMLALLMMEPPASFEAERIRDEKTKLLRAVRPADPARAVRGQYTEGKEQGTGNREQGSESDPVPGSLFLVPVPGYRQEPDVAPNSEVETFVALELAIDNWRWAGVPVYLRTGKRLPYRATELEVAFKPAPGQPLSDEGMQLQHPNHLVLGIQPDEKLGFVFLAKVPGPEMQLEQVEMDFAFRDSFMVEPAEAYERLIHDVMMGDPTLFVREDAVDRAWEIVQPLLDEPPPLTFYAAGTWGPDAAQELVAPSQWHLK